MIKITHKEVAKLINKSEGYVRQLLHRRKIKLKQCELDKVFDLVAEYRNDT